jgi:hypothetical protein
LACFLLSIDGDYAIGAHPGAESAANAGLWVKFRDGAVTLDVQDVFIKAEDLLWAGVNAETAALASVG